MAFIKFKNQWLKLGLALLGFVVISVGLGYLIKLFLSHYQISDSLPAWIAMLSVFFVLAVVNLSMLPLPFGVSLMLVAAAHWNPVLVALFGSLGSTIGEFSGYIFGFLGKKIAINENTPGYNTVRKWISRYGMWAIAFLSFQPVIPFEIGGFIAGAAKMPVKQFLPASWLGKFPKYLILIYLGDTLLKHLPFF